MSNANGREHGGLFQTSNLLRDIRFALRMLRKNPQFTVMALLTLALGIGANTTIFSVIEGVLVRPLGYHEPERLFSIREVVPQLSHLYPTLPANPKHFAEWQQQCSSLEDAAEMDTATVTLAGTGEPEQITASTVSWNLFRVLGVSPQQGRTFLEDEGKPGRNQVVVITDSLWRRRFSSHASISGDWVRIDGALYQVVGVLSPSFNPPKLESSGRAESPPEAFTPLAIDLSTIPDLGEFDYEVIARIRQGVTPEQALAELNVVQSRIAADLPNNTELSATIRPLRDAIVGSSRKGLLVLFAAVGTVLLLVCVNLANLLLARATDRRHESAIRLALGASRTRLVRQLLTESLVLSLLGGGLGVALANWGVALLVKSAPTDLARLNEVRLNWTVLLFGLAASTLASVVFSTLPTWRLARVQAIEVLRGSSNRMTEGTGSRWLRKLLVSAEVGISLTLVVAAGLLLASFARIQRVEKGFQTENLLTFEVTLPATKYEEDKSIDGFYTQALDKIQALPGVAAAGLVSVLPLQGESWVDALTVEGDHRPITERPQANYRFASPDYFNTVGMDLRSGSVFEARDRSRRTAVVSEGTAQKLWPGESAVGKRFRRSADREDPFEIVGVVADIRGISLTQQPGPMVYVPYWQRLRTRASIVVRTPVPPSEMAAAVRAAIWQVDDQVPLAHVQTMEELVAGSVSEQKFQSGLILLFAASALLLASVGIYGVVAESTASRVNEIGIRMALGADRGQISRLVLREGMAPVVTGLAMGLALSLAVGQTLNSLLFEIKGADPVTLIAAMAGLALVALVACYLPARRASRLDPMTALRYE